MGENEVVTGMEAVVTKLTSTLSADSLWGVVGSVVPFLGICTLFGLGFYLVKRILNKAKRAKGGM